MPRYKVVKGFALGIKPCYNPHMKACAICSKVISADRRQLQPHTKNVLARVLGSVQREGPARDGQALAAAEAGGRGVTEAVIAASSFPGFPVRSYGATPAQHFQVKARFASELQERGFEYGLAAKTFTQTWTSRSPGRWPWTSRRGTSAGSTMTTC